MPDKELVLEILRQIEESADKIVSRFQTINQVTNFTNSPSGIERMDAISMMLVVIGESLKNLDKVTGGTLLSEHPGVDWKKAKGMRDILTHHYANVDAEAVFLTCQERIPQLLRTIQKIRDDLR